MTDDVKLAERQIALDPANAAAAEPGGDEISFANTFPQTNAAIKTNAALTKDNHDALVGIQSTLAEIKQMMGGTPPPPVVAPPPPVVTPPPPVVTPPGVVGEPDLGTLPAPASTQKISVNGKDFVDAAGKVVVPRGVNFSGFSFVAVQGWDPADPSGAQGGQPNGPKYSAITGWGANVIRFPLNEASWLGYSCTDTDGVVHNPDPGKNYKTAVKTQVDAALAAGLYVILDLHWTAPGTTCPMLQTQMADADHSLDFWSSIANTFKNYHGVMFELFNEPFLNVDFSGNKWTYMMKGTAGSFTGYPATSTKGTWKDIKADWDVASYQQMINAVRATGATNVVLVGTMQYSQDFSRWLASKPTDPLNQMAAAFHPYPTFGAALGSPAAAQPNFAPQVFTDAGAILTAGIPVIATETGDHNAPGTVGSPLVSTVTQLADANGVGVLGWTWDVWSDPDNVLIKDVDGTPTDGYGQVFKAWLESHKAGAPPVVVDPPPVVVPPPVVTPPPVVVPPVNPPPASGVDLSQGLKDYGKGLIPFSKLAKPAKGQTVRDPDMPEVTITRITDAVADFKAHNVVPAYPTTQAFNCDESRFVLYTQGDSGGGKHVMYDGKTYAFIKVLDINPDDVERFYWDTSDSAVMHYISNHQDGGAMYNQMISINVETGAKTISFDFAATIKAQGWSKGGPVMTSYPFALGSPNNDIWGLACEGIPNIQGYAAGNVFGFQRSTGKIILYKDAGGAKMRTQFPTPLPSGRGFFVNNTSGSSESTDILDVSGKKIGNVPFSSNEHCGSNINAAGDDYLAGVQFETAQVGNLIFANLTKGTVKTLIGQSNGYGYPRTGSLAASACYKNPGWCVTGMVGDPRQKKGTFLDQEMVIAHEDGRVFRLCRHRSTGYYTSAPVNNYWAQPNVTISPSGTRILVQSDWGNADPSNPVVNPDAVSDTYVITLPSYSAD